MAGHSKWANIKHRKQGVDKKRGMVFTKLSKELMVSARLGGADPASNARLRTAITKARAASMPRDTIERAVKKGAGELEGQTFEDMVFEIYAAGGVGVIVEVLTDNKKRTTPEIKNIITKQNANLAESGAVSRLFERKGQIILDKEKMDEDAMMELALEAGADDLRTEEEYYEILTAPEDFSAVQDALSDKEIEVMESSIRFLPIEGTEVPVDDPSAAQKLLNFVEKLEDNDDVQSVYHNMSLSDEVAGQLE